MNPQNPEVKDLKLSIVVPVYNTRAYLAACLDSVIDPHCVDYEIIVVNDGSTDDSGTLASAYAARHPGLIRVITTENGGLGHARNVGIDAAQGEFLFFLDSDDRLAPGALPELMEALAPDRDMILCDFLSVDTQGRVLERLSGSRSTGMLDLAHHPELILELPSGCNKICRRSLFLDSGIRFPDRVWYEDLRTMPKLYLHTDRIFASGKAWYLYLTRPGSITKSSTLVRNLEIIDAVDDLIAYYRAQGADAAYVEELEYTAFYNMLLAGSVRVCLADVKSPVLPALREAFLSRFPKYRSNPYVRSMPAKHRLLTGLLLHGHYGAVAALMRLNAARKRQRV